MWTVDGGEDFGQVVVGHTALVRSIPSELRSFRGIPKLSGHA